MKRKKYFRSILLIGLLGAVLFAAACQKKEQPVNATTAPVVDQQQTIEASGKVKANHIQNVILDFPSSIESVHVKNGQRVKKGDLLFTLNIKDFEKEVKDKEKELAIEKLNLQKISKTVMDSNKSSTTNTQTIQNNIQSAQKELTRLNKDLHKKQSELSNNSSPEIKQLLNALENAQQGYEKERKDFTSHQALFNAGGISKQQLDAYKLQLDEKEKQVKNAKLSLESAQYNHQNAIDLLKTSIQDQSTKINNWNLELTSTKITETTDVEVQKQKISSLEAEIARLKEKLNKSYIREGTIIADVENGTIYEIANNPGDVL